MDIHINSIVRSLPDTVPFVSQFAMERERGKVFDLHLGANESQFGISPNAVQAIRDFCPNVYTYGDPEGFDLRNKISEKHDLERNHVMLGSGVDELLGLVVRAFTNPGDKVVASHGAYPTFIYHVHGYGAELCSVPYREDFYNDVEGLLSEASSCGAKILYLVNPDNPSGTYWKAEVIKRLIDKLSSTSCILLLDEAYIDFVDDDKAVNEVNIHPQVIHLRTFSKAYGMAGLRLGYALSDEGTLQNLRKINLHFGINSLAQVAALAALDDQSFVDDVVRKTREGRQMISSLAKEYGFDTPPSMTNFVALHMGSKEKAAAMTAELLERGVFVRQAQKEPHNTCVRVTIGRPEQMEKFSAVFSDICKNSLKMFTK
ncbi:MAG: histidinol-phosphate aminotransferase [Chlamydiales bacterium]|jgi:histidinol-phosphate aminotransferase